MSDSHSKRFSDTTLGALVKLLPMLVIAGTFLIAWGGLKARVDYHDQVLQEMRQDIKEILRQVKQ